MSITDTSVLLQSGSVQISEVPEKPGLDNGGCSVLLKYMLTKFDQHNAFPLFSHSQKNLSTVFVCIVPRQLLEIQLEGWLIVGIHNVYMTLIILPPKTLCGHVNKPVLHYVVTLPTVATYQHPNIYLGHHYQEIPIIES